MMNRRHLLATGLSGAVLSGFIPGVSWAAASTDKRFIFVIQRGAADGLATLAPIADPDFLRARGDLAKEALTGAKLDSFFALHPKMTAAAQLFAQKQASFVHAVASGYRERSHFDAQNILESGGAAPYARKDGWMNRLLSLLPKDKAKAIAIAPSVPLILRGDLPASSYEQSRASGPGDDAMRRMAMLYAEDAQLSKLWEEALATEQMAMKTDKIERGGAAEAKMVAGLMSGAGGARVLMLESNGWDTHSAQNARLGNQLKRVDEFVEALKIQMAADWANTLVIVATEFGRTVAFNGTQGTDHGTASAAMLFGGNLQHGGKIIADWPGMAASKLYEGRDLRPTMRFEDMIAGALSHHYGLENARVKKALFPDFA
jgi:uncharacterized protein (DUF1501 family)